MSFRMSDFRLNRHVLLGLILLLAGCSEGPRQAAAPSEPAAPPEPVEGQKAFYQMYVAARNWAPDAQGLRLESVEIPAVPGGKGLSGAWRATFVSPSRNRTVIFNYAVVESSEKFLKGVFQDHEDGYSPGGLEKPWLVSALKTTSVSAYEVAMEQKQTQDYVKKNPDTPIMILLEHTNRHPDLAWRIIWGTSVSTSNFSVYVDASTGEFLEILR